MKGNFKTRIFDCVINIPNPLYDIYNNKILQYDYLVDLIPLLDKDIGNQDINYYANVHDQDLYNDGTEKLVHMHLVLQFVNPRSRDALIDYLSRIFKIPPNCVSVERAKDIYGAVQYLTHKNDLDKYQYDVNLCMTNSPDNFEYYYKYKQVTYEMLRDMFDKGFTYNEILDTIGDLKQIRQNQYFINSCLKNWIPKESK